MVSGRASKPSAFKLEFFLQIRIVSSDWNCFLKLELFVQIGIVSLIWNRPQTFDEFFRRRLSLFRGVLIGLSTFEKF